ncbi:MAG: DinB family protein [Anditalea sp.]
MMQFPVKGEYGDSYEAYIAKVKGQDISALLVSQIEELRFFFDQLSEEKAGKSYLKGKWSYKQLLGHINDTEKVMFFRALCFARNEKQPLPGFDQDDYVNAANFNDIHLTNLLEDFDLTRRSLSYFLKNLPEEAFSRTGTVNEQTMSVRALLHIIPGHFEHHLTILKSIPQSNPAK